MTARSLIQRSAVIVGLLLLSVYLFYIGKGHTLLIDTTALKVGDKEYRSAETVSVSVNGLPAETMGRAERIMLAVGGPSHSITIEVISGPEKVVTQKFAIPTFLDTAVISVPAILGGAPAEHWVTRFTPPPVEDAPVEQMIHQE